MSSGNSFCGVKPLMGYFIVNISGLAESREIPWLFFSIRYEIIYQTNITLMYITLASFESYKYDSW